jgi:hypothetical protein
MSIKEKDFVFGIILTHLLMTKGEDSSSRALIIPFLAIHAKGGESMSPKQKDRTTTKFKNFVFSKSIYQLISYYVQKGDFKNDISKPSWTLRGGFNLGGVLFSQRKSIWNKGRKLQNLENALQKSYSFTFDYLQKIFEMDLQKNLQKQNMWCKRGPKCYIRKKHSIHIL